MSNTKQYKANVWETFITTIGKKHYSPKNLCSVYYAIVESYLCYANEVWGSLSKTKLDILQRLQDSAWAIIENARLKDNGHVNG